MYLDMKAFGPYFLCTHAHLRLEGATHIMHVYAHNMHICMHTCASKDPSRWSNHEMASRYRRHA